MTGTGLFAGEDGADRMAALNAGVGFGLGFAVVMDPAKSPALID